MKDLTGFATRGYFAAANGYTGFRSYFDEIFAPEKFARIFILKGGPGTGKSTLMQKFATHFFEKGVEVDAILCSSDSDSLDGVILHGAQQVAVLDGTSPHVRDTLVPGAVDELVDLGSGWNTAMLTQRREEILLLQEQKKRQYQSAYESLNIAGHIYLKAQKGIRAKFDTSRAREVAKRLAADAPVKGPRGTRLFEAFSRNGMERMERFEATPPVFVRGEYETGALLLSLLSRELSRRGAAFIRYPSPLLESKTDGILLGGQLYLVSEDVGELNAEELLQPLSTAEHAEYAALCLLHDRFTSRAAQAMARAAAQHAALEEIYREAMDFSQNEATLQRLIAGAQEAVNL